MKGDLIMKKFYEVVGKLSIKTFQFLGVVVLCVLITSWIYEEEKDQLWFEVIEKYNTLYENDQEQLFEQYGVKQYDQLSEEYIITNI
jgi:hypothetical protein